MCPGQGVCYRVDPGEDSRFEPYEFTSQNGRRIVSPETGYSKTHGDRRLQDFLLGVRVDPQENRADVSATILGESLGDIKRTPADFAQELINILSAEQRKAGYYRDRAAH